MSRRRTVCTAASAARLAVDWVGSPSVLASAAQTPATNVRETSTASGNVGTECGTFFWTHGVLGSSRNLKSVAKAFAERAEKRLGKPVRCGLVDLRCHGASAQLAGIRPPHDLRSAANDFVQTISVELPEGDTLEGLVGHSLGGKVVLQYLEEIKDCEARRRLLPRSAWVLDSVPAAAAGKLVGDTEEVLASVAAVDLSRHSSPSDVARHFEEALGFSKGVSAWLSTSVVKEGTALRWKFDIAGCRDLFQSYQTADLMPIVRNPPSGTAVHFVKAERSPRLDGDVGEELGRLSDDSSHPLQMHILKDAGHWLHVDQPRRLLELMAGTL